MARKPVPGPWPVLKEYTGEHVRQIAMPLGGIGTGTVSIGGRGDLRDWEIMNRPAKGFTPENTFFALRAKAAGQAPVARLVEGALLPPWDQGASGVHAGNAGLPRFRECVFRAAYPLAQVYLADPDVPLRVRIEAFNPLSPPDPDRSGLPVAILRFVLHNNLRRSVAATICANLKNFIGRDRSGGECRGNVNTVRRARKGSPVQGIFLSARDLPTTDPRWGTMALVTRSRARCTVRRGWRSSRWHGPLLDFWDDLLADGRLTDQIDPADPAPVASLAMPVRVPARGQRAVTFLLAWHFPNRPSWSPARKTRRQGDGPQRPYEERVGNHYATRFRDAWDVAVRTARDLRSLERDTVRFVRGLCESDLPEEYKDAALSNVSTLRTQTCFRTSDGHFFGYEGCTDTSGCCRGSCTHVWGYEHATAHLFGSLARDMRATEFLHATDEAGFMSGRVELPLDRAREYRLAHADGQMSAIMRVLREWHLSGDSAWLKRLWPRVKAALAFAWRAGGWDADQDGVMEGCQHNTEDVEYYGPNPLVGVWYLGALRAAQIMAEHLGETAFAAQCRALFEHGSRWMDAHLFNGDYYEQEVRPPLRFAAVAPGLRAAPRMGPGGAHDPRDPEFQVGRGCRVDQLAGQVMAHVCGLGHLLRPAHVRKALAAILRHNRRAPLYSHFNHRRTYALSDEAGVLTCTYPHGERPRVPTPYYSEVWTGLEYTLAAGLQYEGRESEARAVVGAVRARHDGRRRNPFDEPECGHHYARAMASWALVGAWSGFGYDGVEGAMRFADKSGRHFWTTGGAWGTCRLRHARGASEATLTVGGGSLYLASLAVGRSVTTLARPRTLRPGQTLRLTVPRESGR